MSLGVGLGQLVTSGTQYAPLVYKNFSAGTNLHDLKTTKKWKVEVHQTTPPTCACAVCHLQLRAETKSKKDASDKNSLTVYDLAYTLGIPKYIWMGFTGWKLITHRELCLWTFKRPYSQYKNVSNAYLSVLMFTCMLYGWLCIWEYSVKPSLVFVSFMCTLCATWIGYDSILHACYI